MFFGKFALFLLFLRRVSSDDFQAPFEVDDSPTSTPGPALTPKYVVAHHIVGNTYPYDVGDWAKDIALASSKGIDAFALNVGRDYWQFDRVADAFTAARNTNAAQGLGSTFKLFMSFDMSSLPCSSPADARALRDYITMYQSHPNQLMYQGAVLISTFAGEGCRFGQSGLNEGWKYVLGQAGLPAVHFVPSFFVDPATFGGLDVMNGAFNWNSAWPMGDYDINTDADKLYIKNLGGRTYMAGVSPWFFTHYGPDTYNKNFIYRGDDWLFAERWELLFQTRDSIDIAQVITWNDYGESHYVGPIAGAQPNSQAWTTGFDHQGWLDLMHYYIVGFKTGKYPDITRDRVFLWARLFPASADAPADHVGKPQNWAFTEDYLWAVIFLTSPATAVLSCGSSNMTQPLTSGLSKIRLPLVDTGSVRVGIWRDDVCVLDFSPKGFNFDLHPPSHNFNAFVAASL